MISFKTLNIILGGCAGAILAFLFILYWKKKNADIKISKKTYTINAIVIISVVSLSVFQLSSLFLPNYYAKWYLISEINKVPIMTTVREYYPLEYKQLMDKVDANVSNKDDTENVIAFAYIFANKIFMRSFKVAPDNKIHQYLISVTQFYNALYKIDPKLIIKLEQGDLSLLLELNYLMNDQRFEKIYTNYVAAKKDIMVAAFKNPASPANEKTGSTLLNSLMNNLRQKYGRQAVNDAFNATESNIPIETKAKIIINFYEDILNLDQDTAGTIMRYIGLISEQENQS